MLLIANYALICKHWKPKLLSSTKIRWYSFNIYWFYIDVDIKFICMIKNTFNVTIISLASDWTELLRDLGEGGGGSNFVLKHIIDTKRRHYR